MCKKNLAEESEKIRKTREKLRKRLLEMEQEVTPQALKRKTSEIHRWIARHASNRVALKTKSIALFDENQNAAAVSSKISQLAKKWGVNEGIKAEERKRCDLDTITP